VSLTDRQEEILTLFETGMSRRAIGRKLGLDESVVRRHLKRIHKKTELDEPGAYGTSELRGPDGEQRLIWVKKTKQAQEMSAIAREIVDALNEDITRAKPTKKPKIKKADIGYMNSFVFGDPHLNMRAWHQECGFDWDLDIAVQRHIEGMLDLIENARPAHTGRLISLGDLLHNDGLRPTTLNLTAVDVDGRLKMAAADAVKLLRFCIDLMLEKYEQVDVVIARGNHSPSLEIMISMMLEIAYEKERRVAIIDNTVKHIPLVFGNNFQLITHGDRLNHQKKADIATSMFKELHGAAKFTHILSGHLHHHDSKELSGVLSEIFQVLPTKDGWSVEGGFVSADQSACVIRYHPEGGIVDRHFYNPRFKAA
jgi:hypothetical protein